MREQARKRLTARLAEIITGQRFVSDATVNKLKITRILPTVVLNRVCEDMVAAVKDKRPRPTGPDAGPLPAPFDAESADVAARSAASKVFDVDKPVLTEADLHWCISQRETSRKHSSERRGKYARDGRSPTGSPTRPPLSTAKPSKLRSASASAVSTPDSSPPARAELFIDTAEAAAAKAGSSDVTTGRVDDTPAPKGNANTTPSHAPLADRISAAVSMAEPSDSLEETDSEDVPIMPPPPARLVVHRERSETPTTQPDTPRKAASIVQPFRTLTPPVLSRPSVSIIDSTAPFSSPVSPALLSPTKVPTAPPSHTPTRSAPTSPLKKGSAGTADRMANQLDDHVDGLMRTMADTVEALDAAEKRVATLEEYKLTADAEISKLSAQRDTAERLLAEARRNPLKMMDKAGVDQIVGLIESRGGQYAVAP